MSPCAINKVVMLGGSAVALSTLPGVSALDVLRDYGITGLLLLGLVAIYLDNRNSSRAAELSRREKELRDEERRNKREEKQDQRYQAQIEAMTALTAALNRQTQNCEATRQALHTVLERQRQ